ncbi:MAG: hypothetical protein HOH04_05180 [Rhodospirillaceae bacterium]|jgi:hypothetical protein|nr:hypothetical protein [Rhodospirillaceae bacterium]
MSEQITVSKAAKLLNINRSELRARLRAASIETFEGEVGLEQLRCIAPDLRLSDQEILERVRILRNDASKPPRDNRIASAQDLAAEVHRLKTALTIETEMAAHYRDIVEELGKKLGTMQTADDEGERRAALQLCKWLREKATSSE